MIAIKHGIIIENATNSKKQLGATRCVSFKGQKGHHSPSAMLSKQHHTSSNNKEHNNSMCKNNNSSALKHNNNGMQQMDKLPIKHSQETFLQMA